MSELIKLYQEVTFEHSKNQKLSQNTGLEVKPTENSVKDLNARERYLSRHGKTCA